MKYETKIKKSTQKNVESVWCWTQALPWSILDESNDAPLKPDFIFHTFLVRHEILCHSSESQDFVCFEPVQVLYAITVSGRSCVSVLLCLEDIASLGHLPLVHINFLPPHRTLSLKGRVNTFHLGLVFQGLSLSAYRQVVSLCFSYHVLQETSHNICATIRHHYILQAGQCCRTQDFQLREIVYFSPSFLLPSRGQASRCGPAQFLLCLMTKVCLHQQGLTIRFQRITNNLGNYL